MSWNLVETLRFNLLTVIIIGVCGVMFVISLIVAVIVISNRVTASSPGDGDPEGKQSPTSHHLLYDHVNNFPSLSSPHTLVQIGLVDENDYNNLYDSNSLVGDVYGKVGVIVYDDLRHPHLVETDPGSILAIRSPVTMESEERSSGDGGSDKGGHYDKLVAGPQYATVGRRLRTEDIYTSLRRPDGESDQSEEQFYEDISRNTESERDKSLSSETSSLSQATVRLAKDTSNNSSTNNLYAKVDIKMKKKVNQNSHSPGEERKGER